MESSIHVYSMCCTLLFHRVLWLWHTSSAHLLAPPYTNICFRKWSSNRSRELRPLWLFAPSLSFSPPCLTLGVFFSFPVLRSPVSVFALHLLLLTPLTVCLFPEVNRSLVVVGLVPILNIPPASPGVAVERHQERSTHPAPLFLSHCQTPNTNSTWGRHIVSLTSSFIGISKTQRSQLFECP